MTLFTLEGGAAGQPTVLFLHGAAVSSWMWAPTLAALPGRHTLAPDLPGLARSAHLGPFTLAGAADALAAFIQARATGGQVDVVGHSLGGAVAAELLARHPQRVRRAALLGVTTGPVPMAPGFVAGTWAVWHATRSRRLLAWQARALGVPAAHRAQFVEENLAQTWPALAAVLREALAFRAPEALPPVPLLALVGAREGALNVRSARALAGATPGGQAFAVPGGGHAWFATRPELLHATLRAWLAGQPLPDDLRPLPPAFRPAG